MRIEKYTGKLRALFVQGPPKLSDYVEAAAAEYVRETGRTELDSRWIAEFFQDSGLMEAYPRQGLVAFCALVQKVIDRDADRAARLARRQMAKIPDRGRKPPKE